MQITINHQSKSISFGSVLMVALKEEVAEAPFIQVICKLFLINLILYIPEKICVLSDIIFS